MSVEARPWRMASSQFTKVLSTCRNTWVNSMHFDMHCFHARDSKQNLRSYTTPRKRCQPHFSLP